MWLLILTSILPIGGALVSGVFLGRHISKSFQKLLIQSITYFIWVLLIVVGIEFGKVLTDPHVGLITISHAFLYATGLSLFTFLGLIQKTTKQKQNIKKSLGDILSPVKECCIAVAMVGIGILIYLSPLKLNAIDHVSQYLLYFIIFLIGIDLSGIHLQRVTRAYFYVPMMTVVALIVTAFVASCLSQDSFATWLVVGGGFGWFSLSGSLVAQLTTEQLGTQALLVDLFREFYAIVLLYLYGDYQARAVIGVCGATAMDSTLPFIKKNCGEKEVQIAILSGLILTILAPFWLVVCAGFL